MIETKKTTTRAQGQNLNAALTYALGWMTGIIFLLIEKQDDFIRFHAAQSVLVFGMLTILSIMPFLGWLLSPFVFIAGIVFWIILMVKAYQGERYKLPIAGDYAEQLKAKIK